MAASRNPIATIQNESSASACKAWVSDSGDHPEELLSQLVVYHPSDGSIFLGIVEDVYFEYDIRGGSYKKSLRLRNLLCFDRKTSKTSYARNAPRLGSPVYLADENDFRLFFPIKSFPDQGYVGTVRGTSYTLPLDLDRLCFANTAIVAGINHGKSNLAALVASEFHLSGKSVLIIDPSGEWSELMRTYQEKLKRMANQEVKISTICGDSIEYDPNKLTFGPEGPPPWVTEMWEAFEKKKDITILDVSLAHRSELTAEQKLDLRCKITYYIQQRFMRVAQFKFSKEKKPYASPTCIVLEEAHEFVPSNPTRTGQQHLNELFSISTKEYRKFGTGHLFIDQSLRAIHSDLQIQTFLLGATTQPADLSHLEEKLGKNVATAVQRTIGGIVAPSWVAFGAATPMSNLPWELESLSEKQLSIFANRSKAAASS
jgi:hypothetical protein